MGQTCEPHDRNVDHPASILCPSRVARQSGTTATYQHSHMSLQEIAAGLQ